MAIPSVHSIGISESFVKALAKHLLILTNADSFQLAQYKVLLPSRRACRSLAHELVMQSPNQAILLPKMMPLGDLDPEELALPPLHDIALPPAICQYERHGILLTLILKHAVLMGSYQDSPYSITLATQLAADLARLIDQIAWEGLDYRALDQLVPEEYAGHWQLTLDFLKIVTHFWPEILKEKGVVDPATHRRLLLEAYAQKWATCPPDFPVIAAGSTGSIPATAQLLKVISSLPRGQVILPGLDMRLSDDAWASLPITHPQYGMKHLLETFGMIRADVKQISTAEQSAPRAREMVISCALQPLMFTDQFLEKSIIESAQDHFSYLEAQTPQEEALLIAVCMREIMATTEKNIALITPDRDLAERVKLELKRWNLVPDDSAGQSFIHTHLGKVFTLLARIAYNPADQINLLTLLKSRYINKHKIAASIEMRALRGHPDLRTKEQILQNVADDAAHAALLDIFQVVTWPEKGSIGLYITLHMKALSHIVDADSLEGIEELQTFVHKIEKAARYFPDLSRQEYCLLIQNFLGNITLRQPTGHHPRLFILGTLEARTQKMDVMILGGLNEGTWPATMTTDPWLNRSMREEFGLPLPERRIGLSAHDFAQAFCSDTVILTRATKVDGVPTVPSRWFMRLKTMFEANGIEAFSPKDTKYHAWIDRLTHVKTYKPCTAPSPCPPLEARPRHLSVSSVDMWMRDPYALYANKILNLKSIDPLNYEVSAREKGILVHRALELFFQHDMDAHAPDARQKLIDIGYNVFQPFIHVPLVQGFWWPRFQRIAEWFIDQQQQLLSSTITLSEVWGHLTLQTATKPFTISAKADRIDCTPYGLHIIDYKTGSPASMQEIRLGYACQLPLEAAIALAGGFEGLKPCAVKELAFWKLSGGEPAGDVIVIQGNVDELARHTLDGLKTLIEVFDDPNTPYRAFPRSKYALKFNDYIHLARIDEWNRQFDGENS